MRRPAFGVLGIALILGGHSQLRADVIAANLGAGGAYESTDGLTVGHHPGFPVSNAVAVQFTPSGDYAFADAVLALGFAADTATREIDLNLTTDVAGRPGAVLESFSTTGEGAFPPSSLVTFTSALHPALAAGGRYWLVAFAPGTTDGVWNFNSTNDLGTGAANANFLVNDSTGGPGGPWTPMTGARTAFEVDGALAAVPEPGSLALCGVATVGLLATARRRGKRVTA